MVLDGEEKVDEKHRDERNVDAVNDDLGRHAKGKVGHESEQRVAGGCERWLTIDGDGGCGKF